MSSCRCCRSPRPRPTPNGSSSRPNSPTSSPIINRVRRGRAVPLVAAYDPTSTSGTRRRRCCSSAASAPSRADLPPLPCASCSRRPRPHRADRPTGSRCTSPRTTSGGCSPPTPSTGCPHIAQVIARAPRSSTPPSATSPSTPRTSSTHHQAFLARRRALRPSEEYRDRPPTPNGRSSSATSTTARSPLGDCGAPYATPCIHEHACFSELTV